MKNAFKIAGFGLAAGAAAMIAFAVPATARGPMSGFGADRPMIGAMGGDARGGVLAVQFTDLDTDGDGRISEAELAARAQTLAAERLAEVDADGDGTVTAEELEAQILARIGERTQGRYGTGRRAVDPAEMANTIVERLLSVRDADKDGVLSGAELSPAADIAVLIDRFDTDDDNSWSEEEFAQVTARKAGFDKGDRDGRGGRGGMDAKRR